MRRRGFTLIELVVSLAVLGIVSIYLTQMLIQQNRAYTVVEQVVDVQNNVRAILDLLERDVRGTGMAASEAGAVCGVDYTDRPDVLFVTDGSVFEYDLSDNPAGLDMGSAGAPITTAAFQATGNATTFAVDTLSPDNVPAHDLDADGTEDSDFRPGGAVIVADRYAPEKGVACGVIIANGVDVGNKRLTVNFEAGAANAAISGFAVVYPAKRYSVTNDLELMRDQAVLAEDVEDLQVSYFFDRPPRNGIPDSALLEEPGSADGNPYEADDWDNSDLREIRLGLVVRSRLPDPNLPNAVPQTLGNRAAAAGPDDGFRRRVLQAVMRPRNVGKRLVVDL